MSLVKTQHEIQLMRESGLILQKAQRAMKERIAPGISFLELDKIAEEVIVSSGAKPAFKGFQGFPGTICAMVNYEVVHGIPTDRCLKKGDLVSIDCGAIWKGWYSDAAFSLIVGGEEAHRERADFLKCCEKALKAGCNAAMPGNTLGDIGHAIEKVVLKGGYNIIPEYTGHGLGRQMHESPHIFNYGNPGEGKILKEGMTLCIEPIVACGKPENRTLSDGWTVVTKDGEDACQVEHCGVIGKDGFEIFA